MPTEIEAGLILAAGGIVERSFAGGPQIALIRRVRYGEEWSLPKGKVKAKEAVWEAAVREVKEETGCDVEMGPFAGTTQYKYGQTPKLVLFWRMRVLGDCAFQPSEEVKELKWFQPREAVAVMTYSHETELVAETYGLAASSSSPAPIP